MLRGRPHGGSGAGKGSGSDSGAGQLDDQRREFIPSDITRSIIDQTPVIFTTVKEGKICDERLGAFRTEIAAMIGTLTLTFQEFKACEAPDYHGG